MKDARFLIFSGYNFRAVIAFCRFARESGIPVSVVARNESDPIFDTDFGELVAYTRDRDTLNSDEILRIAKTLRESCSVSDLVILPSTEFLNRVLIDHQEALATHRIFVPLCDGSLYEQLSDKRSFSDLCQAAGLDVPRELDPEALSFPLVIKPRKYFGPDGRVQFKPILVEDAEMLEQIRGGWDLDDCYYQEFVEGESYYLLYHISKNGEIVTFSQKNLIQQAEGGSIVAAESASLHEESIAGEYAALLKKAGFYGLIMIELRCSETRQVMIEANPRLWGPSQLALDAGIPLFAAFVRDYGFEVPGMPLKEESVRYLWLEGMMNDLRAGKSLAYHGYSSGEFAREIHKWMPIEVFFREDTLQHYHLIHSNEHV